MCSEHGHGCIRPSAQDCLPSALTSMLSLCHDQEPGPSQPGDQRSVARGQPLPTHSPLRERLGSTAKELRILSPVIRGQELQKSADFPLPDKTFPVFQKLLAKGVLAESASRGAGEDPAQTAEGSAGGSGYCRRGDADSVFH